MSQVFGDFKTEVQAQNYILKLISLINQSNQQLIAAKKSKRKNTSSIPMEYINGRRKEEKEGGDERKLCEVED